MLSCEQCFILFCSFPLLFAFVVGGLGFEFCVFVASWRHALRSEWPFIIIIIMELGQCIDAGASLCNIFIYQYIMYIELSTFVNLHRGVSGAAGGIHRACACRT